MYLHYCYCLGVIQKGNAHRPLSPEMREECRRLDSIDRQIMLIYREKLDDAESVQSFIAKRQGELLQLQTDRQRCYNRLRRCGDETEIAAIKSERDYLTVTMTRCRKDVKTAGEVLARIDRMKENLKCEREMQAQRVGRRRNREIAKSQLLM